MAETAKPYSRWTQDTQTAFLLALRFHDNVREAAAVVGRSVGSAYKVRERDPAFAAGWAKVVQDLRAQRLADAAHARGDDPDAPPPVREGRERRDGWDEGRRTRFLTMLSREGSVAEACRAVGLSTTSAYQHRRKSPRFAAAWDRALAEQGMGPIEAAFARGVEGWEEPIVFQGKVVATKRRFSDAALRLLVQREEKRVARAEAAAALASKREATRFAKPEETDKAILAKLDQIEARRRKIGAEDALAFEARMKREGWAP